jgi:hypothetical protein
MTRRTRILAAGAGAILCAVATLCLAVKALWPTGKPAFLETAQVRYPILSAQYIHGTNLMFSTDTRAEAFVRKQLERVGVHFRGSRGGCGLRTDIGIHAITLLCKAQPPG